MFVAGLVLAQPWMSAGTLPVRESPAGDTLVAVDAAVPQCRLSLEQCRNMALENNAYVRNAALDVNAARAQKQEALAEYFPKVSVNAFAFYAFDPMLEIGLKDIIGESDFSNTLQNYLNSFASTYGFDPVYSTLKHGITANVSVMQPIFAGGRIVNGNRLAALGLEAAGLQKNVIERNTSEDAPMPTFGKASPMAIFFSNCFDRTDISSRRDSSCRAATSSSG